MNQRTTSGSYLYLVDIDRRGATSWLLFLSSQWVSCEEVVMDDGPDKKSGLKQIQSIYPGLRTGDFLQYLIISVIFLSLGYLMAYFFGTKMLLAASA